MYNSKNRKVRVSSIIRTRRIDNYLNRKESRDDGCTPLLESTARSLSRPEKDETSSLSENNQVSASAITPAVTASLTEPLTSLMGKWDLAGGEDSVFEAKPSDLDSSIIVTWQGKTDEKDIVQTGQPIIKCRFCLSKYAEVMKAADEIVVTECGHLFCSACMKRALSKNNNCPYCYQPVMRYFPVHF